jgi:hypothetical protein
MALNILKGSTSADMAIRIGDDNYNDPRNVLQQPVNQSWELGTGLGEANKTYSKELTITAGTTTTIVLDSTSLKDIFGNDADFADIGYLRIQHSGGSLSSNIKFGGTWTVNFVDGLDTWAINFAPTDFMQLSLGKQINSVGAGETLTLENTDLTNDATVSIDLMGK